VSATVVVLRSRAYRVGVATEHDRGLRLFVADAAGGVTDEAWTTATKQYDEEQLGALVSLIADINTWNRLNVIVRQPAGDYQPGQWA